MINICNFNLVTSKNYEIMLVKALKHEIELVKIVSYYCLTLGPNHHLK